MVKKAIFLILTLFPMAVFAVAPYFSIRSQSENAARELVCAGWNNNLNLCCMDDWYGNFSITAEYTRSFKPYNIAQSLFGCWENCSTSRILCENSSCASCTPCSHSSCEDRYRIDISGSQVNNRGSHDWLADYFGLPTDYQSCVTFEPRIDTFLVDFNLYLGLDDWCKGMYFRIHAPVVHTRWNLNMCEFIQDAGDNPYQPGYFNKTMTLSGTSTVGIIRDNLVQNFTTFINGCGTIKSNDFTFTPLCFAKMNCCNLKETALSDIQMALGYNVLCEDDYHVGFNVRASAPTGNRPAGTYLFEPIVGNGKHWELGAGLSTHWTFWTNECDCKSMAFYLDANVTHLFKTRQCRTFDLCGKPLSRYMLATQFKTPVEELLAGQDPQLNLAYPPSNQFAGIYSPIANLTTFPVDVSIGTQADLVFMLQYAHNNWSCSLGYNFWAQGCEKIECPCDCCPCFDNNTWGLKGDAFMYGFIFDQGVFTQPGTALSATQSKSTLCNGTNNYPNGDKASQLFYEQNPGIDNRKKSFNGEDELFIPVFTANAAPAEVYTSLNPVLIKLCDIDFCAAATRARSHKLFGNFDYTWCNCECRKPYLGIGFEVEFSQKPCNECCNECDSCNKRCDPSSELSFATSCIPRANPLNNSCVCCGDCCTLCSLCQWGIWVKGGLNF